jgi:hypothetical protein
MSCLLEGLHGTAVSGSGQQTRALLKFFRHDMLMGFIGIQTAVQRRAHPSPDTFKISRPLFLLVLA